MLKRSLDSEPIGVRIVHFIMEKRRTFLTLLIGLLLTGGVLGALYGYSRGYSKKASALLERQPWPEGVEVIARYPRSDAATVVRLALAKKAIEEEKWDEAILEYRKLENLPERQSMLRIAAIHNIALAYRGKKEWDQALSELHKAEKDPGNVSSDYTRLLIAQIFWEKGEGEESKKLFETVSKEALQPEIRKEAEAHLQWINEPKDSKAGKKPSKKSKKKSKKKS